MPEYQGQFIEGAKGKLYLGCYGCWPAEKVIVLLPAFGEEMNLSRAVCTRQAYAFNSIGYSVVSLDYYGTGDSEGEFQDANADIWREDIRILLEWIGSQTQSKPILWGVRFGALLAASYLEQQGDECISGLIFWRPVLDGKIMLNQFFRLKKMNELMQGGGEKKNWFKYVLEGGCTEVAGYEVTPSLVNSIVTMQMKSCNRTCDTNTLWMEPGVETLTPVIKAHISRWQNEKLKLFTCTSPMFWQSPDVYEAPELIAMTLEQAGRI